MADIAKLVEDLSQLTVMEAAELAKALEEAWGVSAAAAVAVAARPVAALPPRPSRRRPSSTSS
jgi:large subunit ribosomal protein L7/L12